MPTRISAVIQGLRDTPMHHVIDRIPAVRHVTGILRWHTPHYAMHSFRHCGLEAGCRLGTLKNRHLFQPLFTIVSVCHVCDHCFVRTSHHQLMFSFNDFCRAVRLSVTFVHSVKTNKGMFEIFSPSGSHTILVFPYQTSWQ